MNQDIGQLITRMQFMEQEINRLKMTNTAKLSKQNYKPTDDMKAAILELVKETPLTTTEIREQLHSNANKTTRAIKELLVDDKLIMRKDGKKKVYLSK